MRCRSGRCDSASVLGPDRFEPRPQFRLTVPIHPARVVAYLVKVHVSVSYLVGLNMEPIIRPVIFPAIRRPMRFGMALAGLFKIAFKVKGNTHLSGPRGEQEDHLPFTRAPFVLGRLDNHYPKPCTLISSFLISRPWGRSPWV